MDELGLDPEWVRLKDIAVASYRIKRLTLVEL